MLTNAAITIYHKIFNKSTRLPELVRYEIPAASWYADQRINVDSAGISSADIYNIRIPAKYLKDYLTPDEFEAAGQPGSKWTVDNGDYFIEGSGADIEKISDINKRFSQVQAWSHNTRGTLKHLRITGW